MHHAPTFIYCLLCAFMTSPSSRFSRFDRTTALIIGVLVIAVGITAILVATQSSQTNQPAGVGGTRIAYLSPSRGPYQVWSVDPTNPNDSQQHTQAPNGVFDFDVSADGRQIAYAATETDNEGYQLYTLDLQTQQARLLLDCVSQDAYCTTAVWRPGGQMLAYQRVENNRVLNLPPSPPRLWILDLSVEPPNTFPLVADTDILGSQPVWSGDGSKLAFYDANSQSVMVYNFDEPNEAARLIEIPAGSGSVGALSPDGSALIFPEYVATGPLPHLEFRVGNLVNGTIRSLTAEVDAIDDNGITWNPNSQQVAITRVYQDERYTRGYQVYSVDVASGEMESLIFDADYQHTALRFSPDGSQIAIDRYNVANADANSTPEIWTYTLADGTLTRVAPDGFYPRWIPSGSTAGGAGN
jgi:Tol biopolymer transport system component